MSAGTSKTRPSKIKGLARPARMPALTSGGRVSSPRRHPQIGKELGKELGAKNGQIWPMLAPENLDFPGLPACNPSFGS